MLIEILAEIIGESEFSLNLTDSFRPFLFFVSQ